MADQIVNEIKIQYETVEGLKKALKDARKELDLAKVSTVEWTNALEKVGSLQSQFNSVKVAIAQATQQTTAGLNTTTTASANASMALLNLNYVIRDSPYFFNNFALGVLAVGNNLNPLIDSFSRLREEAGAKSLSTFALLKQALVGGAGISIAFSIVVTAIQSFVFWQARSKDSVEDTTKALKEQRAELQKLTRGQLQNALQMTSQQLQNALPKGGRILMGTHGQRELMDANGKLITEGEAFDLNERFNLLRQEYLMLGDIDNIENRLTINKQKQKDLNELNFRMIVPQAKTLSEAVSIVEGWIKADEKHLKVQKEKTKELKIQAGIEAGIFQAKNRQVTFMAGVGIGEGETDQRQTENLPSLFPKPKASDRTGASGMIKKLKDMNVNLETGKIFAQQLGDTLAEAFSTGTLRLKEFIQSLIVAISKMLILRAITSFLTGGIGGGASSVGAIPSFAPSLGKGTASLVYVEGKIVADGTKFVADFNNFSNRYTNKIKVGKVGRS